MSEIAPIVAAAEATWGRDTITARQLADARNYVYTHCPPQWLADVTAALFGDDA